METIHDEVIRLTDGIIGVLFGVHCEIPVYLVSAPGRHATTADLRAAMRRHGLFEAGEEVKSAFSWVCDGRMYGTSSILALLADEVMV